MAWRVDRLLLWLPALLGLWLFCGLRESPRLEAELRREVGARLAAVPATILAPDLVRPAIRGRDVALTADRELEPGARRAAEDAARGARGVGRVAFRVTAPVLVQPFTLSLARRGDVLSLRGHVPPGGARSGLLARARIALGDVRIEDDLRTALGAPAGFEEAADFLLQILRATPDGQAELSDGRLAASGAAADPDAYGVVRQLLRAPPAGFGIERSTISPPTLPDFTWSATRGGRRLVLDGFAPSEAEQDTVLKAARALDGDLEVVDRTKIARGLAREVVFPSLTGSALSWLGRLEEGRVELSGGTLLLRGRSPARDVLDELAAELRNPPPGVTLGPVELGTMPASPFRFAARRDGGRIVLSGFAPGADERAAILAVAARRFPLEAVVNRVRIAEGAPAGMPDAAGLALMRLAAMAEGEASLEDRNVRLAGSILYPELAERARRDFGGGFPAGWSATVDIRTAQPEKPLEASHCGDLLADAVRRGNARFEPGRDEPGPDLRKAIGPLADILRRCGPRRITVFARADDDRASEAAADLARRRATVLVAQLLRERVSAELVVAQSPPPAPDDGPGIVFDVRP